MSRDIDARIEAVVAETSRLADRSARPADRGELALAMADGRIPPDLAALYQRANGLALDEVEIWDLGDTLGFVNQDAIRAEYPGGAAFGWNRSDVVFVLDAGDSMHAGAGAVLAVDKVYPGPESAVLTAPDLASFLADAAPGRTPWRAPRLIDRQAARLAGVIAAHPDGVDARPPLPPEDLPRVVAGREVQPTASLSAYLAVCDGLRFGRTGLTLAGAADLAPMPGSRMADGVPGAIRVGRVGQGPVLAVTVPGCGRPSDLVLQINAGGTLADAPSFGRLLPVLTGWITSDAENAP